MNDICKELATLQDLCHSLADMNLTKKQRDIIEKMMASAIEQGFNMGLGKDFQNMRHAVWCFIGGV